MRKLYKLLIAILFTCFVIPQTLDAAPKGKKGKHKKSVHHYTKKKKKKKKPSKATACPSFHKSGGVHW